MLKILKFQGVTILFLKCIGQKVVFCRIPFPTKNRQCKTHLGPFEEYESVLDMKRVHKCLPRGKIKFSVCLVFQFLFIAYYLKEVTEDFML